MMKIFFQKKEQGYSLLELVIYIALFSFVVVIIVQSLLYSIRTYAVAQSYRRLQADGELVMETLTRTIRSASAVVSGSFGTHPSSFTLSEVVSGVTTQTQYSVQNGVLIASDGLLSSALTSNEVSVDNFIVSHVTSGDEQLLRIRITLRTTGKIQTSAVFSNTIQLE